MDYYNWRVENMIEEIFLKKNKLIKKIEKRFSSPFENNHLNGLEVCIHGATTVGVDLKRSIETYYNLKIKFFVENNSKKWNSSLDGIRVVSPEYIAEKNKKFIIIISTLTYEEEILDSYRKLGIKLPYQLDYLNFKHPEAFNYRFLNDMFNITYDNKQDIINLYYDLGDNNSQETLINIVKYRLSFDRNYLTNSKSLHECYFDPNIILPSLLNNEVIYDCGAFNGDTIESFLIHVNNKYTKYFAFEPIAKYCEIIQKKIDQNPNYKNVEAINYAVYSENSELKVSYGGGGQIDNDQIVIEDSMDKKDTFGNVVNIKTITIDEFQKSHVKPTFIKMDVEGSEMYALRGAKNVITKYKPKLAICLYHQPNHLYEIPKYIKQLNPDYRIYIRHYSDAFFDTVLYCL